MHKIYTVIKCFNFNLFPNNHITLSKYKTILCISNHDNDRVLTKYKHSKFITWLSDINSLQKETSQWAEPVSLTLHSVLSKLYTEPSIGASYQISVHLAIRFQRRRFF